MKVRYLRSLDGLRGIAVLLVMAFHGSYGIFRGGFVGVDLFFVVSGYLITSLLWAELHATGGIAFGKFYARRVLRLLPALIVAIVLCLLLWPYTKFRDPGDDQLMATVASLFYFSNFVKDAVLASMNHMWSLSVEEHFYMFWPLTVYFILFRKTYNSRFRLLTILLVIVTIARIATFAYAGEDVWTGEIFFFSIYKFTLFRIDGMLLGAILFFMIEEGKLSLTPASTKKDSVILAGLALFFAVFGVTVYSFDPIWLGGGFIVTNIACVVTVFMALRNPQQWVLTHKAFVWVGKRSYGIYLFHMPIFLYTESFRHPHDIVNLAWVTAFRVVVSLGLAALSYKFIEQPILRYKMRYKANVGASEMPGELTPVGVQGS